MAASVLATYLFFLGGGFTTIAFLPNWLQVVSSFIPTRYAIAGMRQILFYPDLIGVQHDLTVLIGAALGSVIPGSFR
jgi:ABC-type multidrug transport system permease subunit